MYGKQSLSRFQKFRKFDRPRCMHEVPLYLCSIFCSCSLVQVSTGIYRVWSVEHTPNCIPLTLSKYLWVYIVNSTWHSSLIPRPPFNTPTPPASEKFKSMNYFANTLHWCTHEYFWPWKFPVLLQYRRKCTPLSQRQSVKVYTSLPLIIENGRKRNSH